MRLEVHERFLKSQLIRESSPFAAFSVPPYFLRVFPVISPDSLFERREHAIRDFNRGFESTVGATVSLCYGLVRLALPPSIFGST